MLKTTSLPAHGETSQLLAVMAKLPSRGDGLRMLEKVARKRLRSSILYVVDGISVSVVFSKSTIDICQFAWQTDQIHYLRNLWKKEACFEIF